MFFKKIFAIFIALIVFLSFASLISYQKPELKFRYVKVKEGDTFWKLFGNKWEIVSRINKIDRYHLLLGITLKVPLDWESAKKYPFFPEVLEQEKEAPKLILVVIKEQFLAGYELGQLKFFYPVCSGMERGLTPNWFLKMAAEKELLDAQLSPQLSLQPRNLSGEHPTPRGRFKVLYKKIDFRSAIYPKPDGGQPMPFAVMFSWQGYGFHAWGVPKNLVEWFKEFVEKSKEPKTEPEIEPEEYSLGNMPGWPASHGCVRLFLEDAQKLFKWAKIGTVVLIIDSFEDLEK